jgi:hypothetical protein
LQFAIYQLAITGTITLLAYYDGIMLVTQPQRFQLAMEIGCILTLAFGTSLLVERRRRIQQAIAILLLLFAARQIIIARRFARIEARPTPAASRIESKTALWFDQHLSGARVFDKGSVSFWMNVFTSTPQIYGCCDQANTNVMTDIAVYFVSTGTPSGTLDADLRRLWLRVFGIHAIALGGPKSQEVYKDIRNPYAIIHSFPVAWQDGDDYISDLVSRPPRNGLDTEPLAGYARALEDPAYPIVDARWLNQHTISIDANLEPKQIVSLQMNYWTGWEASANGRFIPAQKDNLGFLYIEPGCAGPCAIMLKYTGGREANVLLFTRWITIAGWLGYLAVIRRLRRGRNSETRRPDTFN